MLSWSLFFLSVVLLAMMTLSHFSLLNIWRKKRNDENFKCMDKLGDGSILCHFMDHVNESEVLNVTKIVHEGNFSDFEIRETLIVKIHSLNMPETLPGGLGDLFVNLEELFITFSKLKFLNRQGFLQMHHITFLDLESNEIEEIPQDTFHDLHKLVYLKLNGNKIRVLRAPLLEHLHHLHTFSASWNKIEIIDESLFDHNYELMWIYLAKNNLENIEINFSKIKKLRAVDLRKNLGNCNFLFNINFTNQSTVESFQNNVTKYCGNKVNEI